MLNNYRKIMIGVDGSKESELAFKKAIRIAKQNQATLYLAHVIDTRAFQTITSFDGMLAEQATTMAKQTLEDYKKQATKENFEAIETIIEYGSPKTIMAKQLPKEHAIELIILGATGLNAAERLFIGSVSEYVIRNATCDVLIVRTDEANQLPEAQEK